MMRLILFMGLVVGLAASSLPAWAACEAEKAQAITAFQQQDLPALRALRPAFQACPEPIYYDFNRSTALTFLRAAYAATDPARQNALLAEGLQFARPWPLLAETGLRAYANRQLETAIERLEETMAVIVDPRATPQTPPSATVTQLRLTLEQARALLGSYKPVGYDQRASRAGVSVVMTALPIEFPTNSAALTPKGLLAVQDMRDFLRLENDPVIMLTGHTDERADDAYNCRLSADRLQTVYQMLVAQNYPAQNIRLVAKGESVPKQLDGVQQHSQDEIWAFNRRVELHRNPNAEDLRHDCQK